MELRASPQTPQVEPSFPNSKLIFKKEKNFSCEKNIRRVCRTWVQWMPLSAFSRWAPGWRGWSSRRAPWRRSEKSSPIWCTWPNAAGTWATTMLSWSSWLASGMQVGNTVIWIPAEWHWINCPGNHIYPNQAIGSDCLGEIHYCLLIHTNLVPQRRSSRIQLLWPVTILISYVCSDPILLATLGKIIWLHNSIKPITDPHLPSAPCKPHCYWSLPSFAWWAASAL